MKQVVAATVGPLVVTDFVLAELDFLVLKRLGIAAEKELIAQLIEGVFLREPVSDGDLRRASEITARYRDQELGLLRHSCHRSSAVLPRVAVKQ